MIEIETQKIIDLIIEDIAIIDNLEKSDLINLALCNSLYKALNECQTTAKITKNPDEFYSINALYITTLSIYLDILSEIKSKYINDIDFEKKLNEENKKFVHEQIAIFIALLSKFFRTARSIKRISEIENFLPMFMWNKYVSDIASWKDFTEKKGEK